MGAGASLPREVDGLDLPATTLTADIKNYHKQNLQL